MKLRKENLDDIPDDTEEYRSAVKSVIRCQIQSLLQKLATETGEESIVISTNVTAGTYNHLGSYMGREYLEDGDEFVRTVCEKFTNFCSGMQNQGFAVTSQLDFTSSDVPPKKARSTLPRPKISPRKRPLNSSVSVESPPLKRRPDPHSGDSETCGKGNNSVQSKGSDSSGNVDVDYVSVDNEGEDSRTSWIKVEPHDDFDEMPENGTDKNTEDYLQSQNSIINRPKSLIPLANIFKKYGGTKVKVERSEISGMVDSYDDLAPEKSILRTLCESQPVFSMNDLTANDSPDGSTTEDYQAGVSLPQNLNESIDPLNTTTENLVLSGYYDSDSYPTYRHRQKHLASNAGQSKKNKMKEKSSNASSVDTPLNPSHVDFHLRTFESGGRLVYACDVCKRELSHLTSYRRHMKLHTMERPHKCPVCNKGFIRKYHCIDHLNKHHKGVEYDPDTLTLVGQSVGMETHDHSGMSDSLSISPGEYNYTLDQSLVDSSVKAENDQAGNNSIDQSASNMLSELAKSAAQKVQLTPPGCRGGATSCDIMKVEPNQSDDGCDDLNQSSEDGKSETAHSEHGNDKSNESSPGSNSGSGSSGMARKNEVSAGIKAIVAHLKSASKNKKKGILGSGDDSVKVAVDEI